jgi:hypothetical protein
VVVWATTSGVVGVVVGGGVVPPVVAAKTTAVAYDAPEDACSPDGVKLAVGGSVPR